MNKVSFQGTALTPAQRHRLEVERRMKAAPVVSLAEQVAETIEELERRKEQGAKPEKVWFLVREEKGTPCLAELFGY